MVMVIGAVNEKHKYYWVVADHLIDDSKMEEKIEIQKFGVIINCIIAVPVTL